MPSISSSSSKIVPSLCVVILVFYSKEGSFGDPNLGSPPPFSPPDLASPPGGSVPSRNPSFQGVLAFGDSIVDTGNNNWLLTILKANFPPYGRDFPGGKPTGRFGNGLILSDLIAEGLGLKSPLPAYLDPSLLDEELATGVCFASAGSGLDPQTAKLQNVKSIRDQFNLFKEYTAKLEAAIGVEKAKATISDSLYLISSANNDLFITYFLILRVLGYSINTYTSQLVNWASTFIKDMQGLGARKFAYLSTMPLGCLPILKVLIEGNPGSCSTLGNDAATMFNSKLKEEINNLNSNLPAGAKIMFIDIYTPLLDIINNPNKYGFDDGNRGCCGTGLVEVALTCNKFNPFTCSDPSRFVFWDSVHSSERTYKIIVSAIIDQISEQLLKY